MPHYERIGSHFLDHNGQTVDTDIRLPNGAIIEIKGGQHYTSFQLKFSGDADGWWMNDEALGYLIAELLYIQRELVDYRQEKNQEEDLFEVDPEF